MPRCARRLVQKRRDTFPALFFAILASIISRRCWRALPHAVQINSVVAWAIDRLGRSLIDLLGTIQALEACGVDLYLDQQSIDTTTPAGKLMFQVCGAFAEFERSMIRQRVHAGLKRAVAQGKQLGRPRIDPALEKRIQAQLRSGKGMRKVARECGVGTGTVQRVQQEMKGPFVGAAA
jgi:DNA invertase Pin-like site-specific DNA recombinase